MYNNTQPTFFIYDYETFGLHPALDRPAQFAGIRVNNTLHIIDKIKCFYCRIPQDYIPNPESVLITGITPQSTINSLTESDFAYRIFNILNVPNTCVIGYNNIHFDDEFSRNIFYRNFCDPYSWSYKNGNSRWDLLPVLRTFYSLCPTIMKWPRNVNNNQISFRLTDITHANSIIHSNAHHAKSDVYATLEIMKLLKTIHPQLFQFLYHHRTKDQLKKIIDLDQMNPLLHISNKINNKHKNFINFLVPITWHPTNHNILVTYNLKNNINYLLNCNTDTINHNLEQGTEKISNILNKTSLQLIRLNSCPILIPINFFNKKSDIFDCTQDIFDNYQYYIKNLNLLRININNKIYLKINKLCTIIEYYMNKNKIYNKMHVDNQLYNGFFNYKDQRIIKYIRNTNIENLSTIDFFETDTRLKSLLFFYRARNFPYTLNTQEQQIWTNYKKNILLNIQKNKNYINRINILLSYQDNLQKIKLLLLLKKYYEYFYDTISKCQ